MSKTHELSRFQKCSGGDAGFYWADGADRVVCSCGWTSAAIQRDKKALVALWGIHAGREDAKVGGVAE